MQLLRKIVRSARQRLASENADSNATPLKYVKTLESVEACLGSLDGKRILEVGSDGQGAFLQFLGNQRKPASLVGVNPVVETDVVTERFELRKLDVRDLPFEDGSFDIIISVSVFEHVFGFEKALAEMYRVLSPGGYLTTEFGPIWSSSWGHHMWFDYNGRTINWKNTPLPPYAHLLMTEKEVEAWCTDEYGDPELSQKISNYVFHSHEQNRLLFSDYESSVKASDFEILYFVGHPDVPLREGYEADDSAALFRGLRERYPEESGFGYHLISMLLTRPE